jgi:Asparagine synthase
MYMLDPRSNMIEEEQFYRNLPTGVFTMHPYWYPRLADFLLRIRPETLTAGSQSKSLIRNMLAERFPQLGFERQKKVISIDFPRTVFARELPGLWQEIGPARQMGEMGLVDPKRYQEKIAATLRSRRGRGLYDAWHGATVEAWSRLHA